MNLEAGANPDPARKQRAGIAQEVSVRNTFLRSLSSQAF